jgi:ATP-binding cassette, subfamily B, bacterial
MTHRLLGEIRPYGLSIVFTFAVSLIVIPVTLITPLPIKIIVDNVLGPQPLPNYLRIITPILGLSSKESVIFIAISILLASTVLNYTQNLLNIWYQNKVGNRITLDMRARLFRQMQRLSILYHDTKGVTDSTYRVQNDAPWLRLLVIDTLPQLVTSILTLTGMIAVMMFLDWQLAAIALTITPFMFVFTLVYRKRIRAGWRKFKTSESAAMSAAQESLGAARVVKAFGQEERKNEQFLSLYTETATASLKVNVEGGVYNLLIGAVTGIGLAAVLYIGIGHVESGVLSIGGLLIVNYYLTQIYTPLKDIGKRVLDLQQSFAGMDRFLEILDQEPDVPEIPNARPLSRSSGRITMDNVSFAYEGGDLVLRNVSFDLLPGTCLGVVGPTGSGKTTLSSLLLRFFDPTQGKITLDEVDLKEYKITDLRNQFAIVLQDTVLFSTTVAENIRFAKPEASMNEIVAAAKAANAHEFITSLPDGYDTLVGERGMKISGGERQRVSIARAFLKDAPILILDEPTSALDIHTETAILSSMQDLMRGRTTLMIAHRPTTLRNCNTILTLESGRIGKMTTNVAEILEAMKVTNGLSKN